jgi:hypothetical protein
MVTREIDQKKKDEAGEACDDSVSLAQSRRTIVWLEMFQSKTGFSHTGTSLTGQITIYLKMCSRLHIA